MRVLITGGAGFVGSRIALAFKDSKGVDLTIMDNLRRRGSELNLQPFRKSGIQFVHGDIRVPDDLDQLSGNYDLMIEASAEPSVAAGQMGSPAYTIATNLWGTVNCLEFFRKRAARFLFLSTSRVYSIPSLRDISLNEAPSRFEIMPDQVLPGVTANGISERFPTDRARSFYGTTKLSSEMMIQEYVETYGIEALINRCGVIAGPGQFGKPDQGVFTLWIAHHLFRIPLQYTGFGGTGKQVRDLLHPSDLINLLQKQLQHSGRWQGEIFNVGGGKAGSVSLSEMTEFCRSAVGHEVPISQVPETAPYDVPYYISDCRKVSTMFDWIPRKSIFDIVSETAQWIRANEEDLKPLYCAMSS